MGVSCVVSDIASLKMTDMARAYSKKKERALDGRTPEPGLLFGRCPIEILIADIQTVVAFAVD